MGADIVLARARALEPRKLSGEELRFMRKAMGMKAKDMAKSLGITSEYLSRCENGKKTMSETTEKLFRLYVILNISRIYDAIKIDSAP